MRVPWHLMVALKPEATVFKNFPRAASDIGADGATGQRQRSTRTVGRPSRVDESTSTLNAEKWIRVCKMA